MGPKSKLTTWLRNRLKSSEKQSIDQPPYLPSPRPHNLTPATSCEDVAKTQIQPQPSSCLFFAKLPGDIRREILVLAFGKRTLHMDLVFDQPLNLPPLADRTAALTAKFDFPHAAIRAKKTGEIASSDVRKVWRWGGTVCHRMPPGEPDSVLGWLLRPGPWDDSCLQGSVGFCQYYEGKWPGKCMIGIMGFLLSCKQAYVEAVDVLYSTNCISITSEPLLLNLPKLVLPQRLASITSLELNINGHRGTRPPQFHIDYGHLTPILGIIATHCRALRSLYLSIQSEVYASPNRLPVSSLLEKIDAFYLSMHPGRLLEMRLAVPFTTLRACSDIIVRPSAEHELEEKTPGQPSVRWRCLDGCGDGNEIRPEIQSRSAGNLPGPPLQLPTPNNQGKRVPSSGYWIVEGNNDVDLITASIPVSGLSYMH